MSDNAHLPATRRRALRLLPVALLTSGLAVTATLPPADAVALRTTYTQATPLFLGDPDVSTTSGVVAIPDSGNAASYPSAIPFTHAARVTDVVVDVQVSHTRPDDLQVRLVGPGGQQALLMSNVGGDSDYSGSIIFDDDATGPIPDDGPIPVEPVKPAQALSVFDGTNAAGDWKLYVDDDLSGDSGSFLWALHLSLATSPYPSELIVSNAGTVTDVNVTLDNVTTAALRDVDLLLVGPHGQQSTLLSDVGGDGDRVDVTFDDEATAPLPDLPITSGSYRPTDVVEDDDIYPAPAPVPTGAHSLTVFDGTNANGTWRLFAWDGVASDVTRLSGWSLDIESDDSTAPTGSVTVAGGATVVVSRAVTLGVSASDALSGVTRMRFSNDGTDFGAWQPYAAAAAWTLAPGTDGTRTVYAQFADAFGNASAVLSDTTRLDTMSPTARKTKPAKNAKRVSPTVKVKIVASEALDSATVTKKTVTLKKSGRTVKANVSLTRGTTIVLKPKKPLAAGTYTVTVSKKVTDLARHAFDAKKKPGTQTLRWTFTV